MGFMCIQQSLLICVISDRMERSNDVIVYSDMTLPYWCCAKLNISKQTKLHTWQLKICNVTHLWWKWVCKNMIWTVITIFIKLFDTLTRGLSCMHVPVNVNTNLGTDAGELYRVWSRRQKIFCHLSIALVWSDSWNEGLVFCVKLFLHFDGTFENVVKSFFFFFPGMK